MIDIRRAVSDAYYALFHALAQTCADELIGANKRKTDAWARAYRALEHTQAKDRLKKKAAAGHADQRLVNFAAAFAKFQELRHEADYSPAAPSLNRASTLSLIDEAERAISQFGAVDAFERRTLAAHVLLKSRT